MISSTYDKITIRLKHHSVNLQIACFADYKDFAAYIRENDIPREESSNYYSTGTFDIQKQTRKKLNDLFMGDFLINHLFYPAIIALTSVDCDDPPVFYFTHNYPISPTKWKVELKSYGDLVDMIAPCTIGLCIYDKTKGVDPPLVDSVRYLDFEKLDPRVPDLKDLLQSGTMFYRVYPPQVFAEDDFSSPSIWPYDERSIPHYDTCPANLPERVSHPLNIPEVSNENDNLTMIELQKRTYQS